MSVCECECECECVCACVCACAGGSGLGFSSGRRAPRPRRASAGSRSPGSLSRARAWARPGAALPCRPAATRPQAGGAAGRTRSGRGAQTVTSLARCNGQCNLKVAVSKDAAAGGKGNLAGHLKVWLIPMPLFLAFPGETRRMSSRTDGTGSLAHESWLTCGAQNSAIVYSSGNRIGVRATVAARKLAPA